MNKKLLISVPPKAHIRLAEDEIQGLKELGYECKSIDYANNNQSIGTINKLLIVLYNSIKIVVSLYKFSPSIIYLNSRFEPVASIRDFITILIVKMFYFKKSKFIIKSHGSDLSILVNNSFRYKKIIIPFLTKKVDAWFFLSNEEKNYIKNYNIEMANKVFITANIIDPTRSIPSPNFKSKYQLSSKFKFLFVGRMTEVKGIFTILGSIPLLTFKDNCEFLFVGDGPDLKKLMSRAIELNILNNVRFIGYIPDNECDHFYANTDALIYPTYDSEGFPMALFKSIAVGLPIITTKIRAAKDYLTSPENVLWVDGRSEKSVSEAMTILYQDELLRNSMSQNNKILGRKFSRSKICKQMSEVIESI